MAFNNFPYTNFQDLNLGWILAKIKEALASSAAAVAKSDAVEAEVGTYSQRISDAKAEADSARNIANTARGEALNAQSDATSAIAIGQAAQGKANEAMSAANDAQDTADTAVDSAATAERNAAVAVQTAELADTKATNALNDYTEITITVFPAGGSYTEDTAESHDDVEDILSAELANKKICFILEDARTGNSYYTYDYIIKPIANTIRDMDILVFFDKSINSSQLDYYVVTFKRRAGTGDANDYSIEGADVSFSGGGGSVSGAVLYNAAQSLNTIEKKQARGNISAQPFYTVYNSLLTSGTVTVHDNSTLQLQNTLTGSLTIAFDTDDSELDSHVRCIRFRTGTTANSCMVILPSGVEIPLGFYALDGIYLLTNTVYELVIVNGYMTFNFWG